MIQIIWHPGKGKIVIIIIKKRLVVSRGLGTGNVELLKHWELL